MDKSPKKVYIRRMFDDISGQYDLLNRIISFGLDGVCRKRAVTPHRGDKLVLDICSGTGDMSVELLRMHGFRGVIVMADFSTGMHKLARRKIDQSKNADISERVLQVYCDADNMPFKSGSFEGVINGYSLRNLGNLHDFGREIGRVLKAGGRASLVDVSHPPNRVFAALFHFYFYQLIPLIARFFTRKKYAYRYLPVSLRTFYKQDDALEKLRADGLRGRYKDLLFGAVAVYDLEK